MKISHIHCRVHDLPAAVEWFKAMCQTPPSFSDTRMAVLVFGEFTLILDAADEDSVVTIGFNSLDCDADFAMLVGRGAKIVDAPRNRPYGARVGYLKGPGALTIELEQLFPTAV